jgi:GNAT superfamily N-acetyltransferase
MADWFEPSRVLLVGAIALAETSDGRAVGVVQADFTQGYNERFGRLAGFPGPQCMVHKIAVLPTERRSGTGRLLMHETAREARRRGCTHMALIVASWSTPKEERVAFFEVCGLRPLVPTRSDDLYGADLETVLEATIPA